MSKTLSEIKDSLPADRREKIEQRTADLVAKLKEVAFLEHGQTARVASKAADEIERLRGELAKARKIIEYAYDEMGGKWPAADAFLDGTADREKIEQRYEALVDELREIVAENERLRGACDLYRKNQIADLKRLAEAERLLTTCCGAVDDALQDTIDEYFAGRETAND